MFLPTRVKMSIKIYQVGGSVRDQILGIKSKDIDFAVEAPSWEEMKEYIRKYNEIYLINDEYFTIRALHPKMGAVDYVYCRIDGPYTDGRRPDYVNSGTILDDLARRDFTVNAIAIDEQGNYIDPHNGLIDIDNKQLRTVGDLNKRFNEDSLRIIRALRFWITKDLIPVKEIFNQVFFESSYWIPKLESTSKERIREELYKCFNYNTVKTLKTLHKIDHEYSEFFFDSGLWLMPTFKEK